MSIESRIALRKNSSGSAKRSTSSLRSFSRGHAEEAEMLNMRKHGTYRAHMPAEVIGDAKASAKDSAPVATIRCIVASRRW